MTAVMPGMCRGCAGVVTMLVVDKPSTRVEVGVIYMGCVGVQIGRGEIIHTDQVDGVGANIRDGSRGTRVDRLDRLGNVELIVVAIGISTTDEYHSLLAKDAETAAVRKIAHSCSRVNTHSRLQKVTESHEGAVGSSVLHDVNSDTVLILSTNLLRNRESNTALNIDLLDNGLLADAVEVIRALREAIQQHSIGGERSTKEVDGVVEEETSSYGGAVTDLVIVLELWSVEAPTSPET